MIRIAISSEETLKSESIRLTQRLGIYLPIIVDDMQATAINFPAEFIFVPETDMVDLVENGLVDLAIVRRHCLDEQPAEIDTLKPLNIGLCKLAIVAPDTKKVPDNLNSCTIATSLPNILAKHLKQRGYRAKILKSKSSKKLVQAGVADLYFEPTAQTENLAKCNLRIYEKASESEAVLVVAKELSWQKKAIIDELLFRLESTCTGESKKLVSMHVKNENREEILRLLPSLQTPVVVDIDKETCMLQTIMDEIRFWDIVERLKELEATNIVILPIDKIIH